MTEPIISHDAGLRITVPAYRRERTGRAVALVEITWAEPLPDQSPLIEKADVHILNRRERIDVSERACRSIGIDDAKVIAAFDRDLLAALNQALHALESAEAEGEESDPEDASFGPDPAPREWAIDRMEPTGFTSTVYGGPGGAKTYLAILNAGCTATGLPYLDHEVKQTKVLFLDWELDGDEFKRRLKEVSLGLGLSGRPAGIYYRRMRGPLLDDGNQRRIRQWVERLGVGKVIVDSFSMAGCRDADTATAGIDALDALGTTNLVIDHQARTGRLESYDSKQPYGTMFKEAGARAEWQVDPAEASGDNTLTVALRNHKMQFARKHALIGVRITFGTRVTFRLVDPAKTDGLKQKQTRTQRVWQALLNEVAPTTAKVIAEKTGVAVGTVKSCLTRFRDAGTARSLCATCGGEADECAGRKQHKADPYLWEVVRVDLDPDSGEGADDFATPDDPVTKAGDDAVAPYRGATCNTPSPVANGATVATGCNGQNATDEDEGHICWDCNRELPCRCGDPERSHTCRDCMDARSEAFGALPR